MTAPLSTTKLALAGRSLWAQDGHLRNAEPIAIVGLGLRFPGGINDPESLWQVLLEGRDLIREVPADRWSLADWYDADPATPGRISTRWGAFLDDVRGFDARFFDIGPREAERMDPQQRVALEVACEAIERAGIPLSTMRGSNTGVYFSSYHNDYAFAQYSDPLTVSGRTLTGSLHSIIPNRISYALGLRGPSLTVDSACSSSLVAAHLACQALRSRDCDLTIVGGVNLVLSPHVSIALSKGGFMSPTGHCWTFDARADGFVRGEGCAVVVLKRLSDAIAAGDAILGVIRGSAVNQDGQSTTLSAPNGLAQADMLRLALRNAGLTANDISLLEAHGTGTQLGDPIETDALREVFAGRDPSHGPCWLGSLKSNFGHLEAAAGIAGLIKAVLVLRHGVVPPHALFTELNPHVNLSGSPLTIAREPTSLTGNGPLRAGISSFGVGGTNAHVIVESTPAGLEIADEDTPPPHLLPISARGPKALRGLAARYAALLRNGARVGALVRAAARRRAHYTEQRAAVLASNTDSLVDELERIASGSSAPATASSEPRLCFVFSGQGTQWPGMALALRESDALFRAALEEVDALFGASGDLRPIEELQRPVSESRLDRTDVAQATMFAVQVALLRMLAGRAIRPAVVIGHSVGELAAAHAAGLLTLEEAVRAVLDRGAVMQTAFDTGRMLAVRLTETEADDFLQRNDLDLSIAAVNGPSAVVLSGAPAVVADAARLLTATGTRHSLLDVRFGFHSRLMADAATQLKGAARPIGRAATDITFISTVTGAEMSEFSYEYLATNVRSAVRFRAAIDRALALGVRHFVEIGPHPALGNAVVETAEAANVQVESGYCQHRDKEAIGAVLALMGRLYTWGSNPDWSAIYPGPCAPVALPTYVWEHEPHWLPEARTNGAGATPAARSNGFPGRLLDSPALGRPVFELDASDALFAAFRDHRVGGAVRVPATALVELLRTAAQAAGLKSPVVQDLGILRPVQPDAIRRLQVVLDKGGAGPAEVFMASAAGEWVLAANAVLQSGSGEASRRAARAMQQGDAAVLAPEISAASLYASLADAGVDFGSTFRLLNQVRANERCAEGLIEIGNAPEWSSGVNPAVLDAAAHLCMATLIAQDASTLALLPWAADACHVLQPEARPTKGRAVLRDKDQQGARFDVFLLDANDAPIVWLEGWRLRRAQLGAPALRESVWEPAALDTRTEDPGRWLILEDKGGVARAVANVLEALGHTTVRVQADAFTEADSRPLDGVWRGLLHFGALDGDGIDATGEELVAGASSASRPLLALARNVAGRSAKLRVVLFSRGVHAPGPSTVGRAPAGAPGIGLLRALRAELPELNCTALDLDGAAARGSAEEVSRIIDEILVDNAQAEVALRDDARLVQRTGLSELRQIPEPGSTALTLVHERPGTLGDLVLRPQTLEPTPAGHVKIRVLAAGLNFRDVLTALRSYPGTPELGLECCGIVVEAGSGVQEFRVGDRVLAFFPGCFATFVTVPSAFVFAAPSDLSPAAAATLPVAYCTAWHALYNLGQLRAGQSVLIHAGAGGVGQAAIRLAQLRGARVFATAGSAQKRAFLESCGVAGAFDSRSPAFARAVLEATNGAGVDLVLNSLIGNLIPAGLACLNAGGLFVELGKREVLSSDELSAIRADVRYATFDLRDVARADAAVLPRLFSELNRALGAKLLAPLPVVTLPLARAEAGFRLMARAHHTGKIVFIPPPGGRTESGGWTVLTGGTGGMGAATLQWVLEGGARRVSIWSRRGVPADLQREIEGLRQQFAAQIETALVDVACTTEVEAALAALRASGAPVTDIVHAAGVLDDGTLAQITHERMEAVLRPKIAGAWNLHRATLSDPVSSFVLYSAVGPLIDAAGQGSYAAANAFLDALAVHRRSMGLPAVSIRWGLFREGGMAVRMGEAQQQRWVRKGLGWLDRESGGAAFAAARVADAPEVYAVQLERTARAENAESVAPAAGADLTARLRALPVHQRMAMALEHVRSSVSAMLGLTVLAEQDAPLRDLGMDSLSAIELRNTLTVSCGVSLPATLAFDHPTAAAITRFLLDRMGFDDTAPALVAVTQPSADTEDEIDDLSDEEAERLLLLELGLKGTTTSEAGR